MAAIKPNPTLPDDLISEILVRVPVISLLRFQAVCKTWLSLIKHPAFVKSQLRHATTTKTDQTLIISGLARHRELFETSLLHVDSCKIVADFKFPYPWDIMLSGRLVGFANGIVCVSYDNNLERNAKICLWNPAIRQSKVIPLLHNGGRGALGFGYDPIENDYKVFRVLSFCAEVFSNNKNVWRKLPDPVVFPGRFDVCVNGFLCCIAWDGMMSFDLNKEVVICAIKLPVTIDADDDDGDQIYEDFKKYRIIEYNNSIAFIIMWDNELNDGKKINLWMLDDDACLRRGGVEPSWTPIFSIDLDDWCNDVLQEFIHCYINGDLLRMILTSGDNHRSDNLWITCTADKKDAKIVLRAIHKIGHHSGTVCKYTESLVSITGFKQINWIGGEDDN